MMPGRYTVVDNDTFYHKLAFTIWQLDSLAMSVVQV